MPKQLLLASILGLLAFPAASESNHMVLDGYDEGSGLRLIGIVVNPQLQEGQQTPDSTSWGPGLSFNCVLGQRIDMMVAPFPPYPKSDEVLALLRFDETQTIRLPVQWDRKSNNARLEGAQTLLTAAVLADELTVKLGSTTVMDFDLREAEAGLRNVNWLCSEWGSFDDGRVKLAP